MDIEKQTVAQLREEYRVTCMRLRESREAFEDLEDYLADQEPDEAADQYVRDELHAYYDALSAHADEIQARLVQLVGEQQDVS